MKKILLLLTLLTINGCGGGTTTGDGMLIEGTLTEAGSGHKVLNKHGVGEKIGDVTICALGLCSTTDSEGQWGFVASEDFSGGEVLFTFDGHGIAAQTILDLHSNAKNVFIAFDHEDGSVVADSILVDGQPEDQHEGHDHANE